MLTILIYGFLYYDYIQIFRIVVVKTTIYQNLFWNSIIGYCKNNAQSSLSLYLIQKFSGLLIFY